MSARADGPPAADEAGAAASTPLPRTVAAARASRSAMSLLAVCHIRKELREGSVHIRQVCMEVQLAVVAHIAAAVPASSRASVRWKALPTSDGSCWWVAKMTPSVSRHAGSSSWRPATSRAACDGYTR